MGSEKGAILVTQKANLIGGKELARIREENPVLGNLLQRIVDGVERTALNAGVSATGESSAPPTIGSLAVKAAGGIAHVTINDSAPIGKPVEYFVEHATNPSFTAPHEIGRASHRE